MEKRMVDFSDLVTLYEKKFPNTFYRGTSIINLEKNELMAVICDIGAKALRLSATTKLNLKEGKDGNEGNGSRVGIIGRDRDNSSPG
ncbi:MAG: hypothetical protein PHG66_05935 [Candidatus Colwellbacteria bacterium]|nr:hypothetical protein [Candidatus Colwellbacteria bacterium]